MDTNTKNDEKPGLSSMDPRLDEMKMMADNALFAQALQDEAKAWLNPEKRRNALRNKFRIFYEKLGNTDISDESIDKAIDGFYESKMTFVPTAGGPKLFNRAYIKRGFLGKYVAIPLLTIGLLAGAGKLTSDHYERAQAQKAEASVERVIADAYNQQNRLGLELEALKGSPVIQNLPEMDAEIVRHSLQVSADQLGSTDKYFSTFARDGEVSKLIDLKNYSQARQELTIVTEFLDAAKASMGEAKEKINFQISIEQADLLLDSLIGEIRSVQGLSAGIKTQAETAYKAGKAAAENRQLKSVSDYGSRLSQLKDAATVLPGLEMQVETTYSSIMGIVREDEAKAQAQQLYSQAKTQINGLNVNETRNSAEQLTNLEAQLKLVYDEIIVNVVRRSDNDFPDKFLYYFEIESRTPDGKPFPIPVRNEEWEHIRFDRKVFEQRKARNFTEVTDHYAERGPENVVMEVRADLKDDNNINNNLYGKKELGYLSFHVKLIEKATGKPVERVGQITTWDGK